MGGCKDCTNYTPTALEQEPIDRERTLDRVLRNHAIDDGVIDQNNVVKQYLRGQQQLRDRNLFLQPEELRKQITETPRLKSPIAKTIQSLETIGETILRFFSP